MEPEIQKRQTEERQRLRQHLIFERLLTSGQTFQAEDTAPEIDREKRTAVFSFASEVPVLRWFGYERLNIRSGSIDFERINAAGSLLLNHDPDKQIGVVEKAWSEGGKLYAKVRFSRSAQGEEIFQDVIDGIRRNVSFNYVFPVEGFIFEGFTEDGIEMYRVDRFDIREVSIVSIPADFRVGIGRSLSDSEIKLKESFENHYKEKLKMDDELEGMEGKPGAEKATKEKPSKEKTIKASRSMSLEDDDESGDSSEAADIIAFGEAYNQKELAVKFIKEGRSLSEFRSAIKQKISSKHVQSPMTYKVEGEMGFEEREVRQFSILRALASMVVKNYRGGGYEQEVSEATIKKYGGNRQGHGGIAIPPEVFFYRADPILSTPKPGNAAQTGGANLVGTDTMGSEFIKAFWERLVIGRAGARFMRGLQGNIVIPKQTGKAKAQWVAEGVAPTGSQQTFGQVPMTPKRIADFIDISRLNLLQSSMDMEAFIREDLQAAVAAAVDAAAIYGSGQNLEPRGILNHPDVDVAVDLGADALQFEDIIDMETAVADNNADVDSMVYITNARVRGYLKSVPEAPLTSKMIWTSSGGGEGTVNGYRALASNHVPSSLGSAKNLSAIVFGNFRDLVIGQWGALFLQENPYLNQSAGLVRIDIEQQMDLILRHGESFSVIKTIDTTKRPSFLRTVGSTPVDGGGTPPVGGRSVRRSRKVSEGKDEE